MIVGILNFIFNKECEHVPKEVKFCCEECDKNWYKDYTTCIKCGKQILKPIVLTDEDADKYRKLGFKF